MALPPYYDDGHQTIQYHRHHHEDDCCYSCNTGVTTVKMSNVSEERRQELSIMTEQLEQAKKCIEDLVNCDMLDGTPSFVARSVTLLWMQVLLSIHPRTPGDIEFARRHLRELIINDDDGTRLECLNDIIVFLEEASGDVRQQLVHWYYSTLDPRPTIDVVSVVPGQKQRSDCAISSTVSGPTDGETHNVAADELVTAEAGNKGPLVVAAPVASAQGEKEQHEGGQRGVM